MFIAIAGLHGSGKSTAARDVASVLGWRYYSTGEAFREMAKERGMSLAEFNTFLENDLEVDRKLDTRMVEVAKGGRVVIDGQLVAYLTRDLTDGMRVLLKCPRKIRVTRMGERDNEDLKSKMHETKVREDSERKRFKMLWGVDLADPNEKLWTYDLVIDTRLFDAKTTVDIIVFAARGLFGESL
ncbi:MAG: (d)CMP kinase [Promethearchaeota archaeon]